jgi:ArsR family transcriptional regulator
VAAETFLKESAEAANLLKLLSNHCRLLVLCHLAACGEMAVGELVERVGISQSALSQHLAKLRGEKLVATRKDAQNVYYRICDPRAERLLTLLHQMFCPDLGQEPPLRQAGEINE